MLSKHFVTGLGLIISAWLMSVLVAPFFALWMSLPGHEFIAAAIDFEPELVLTTGIGFVALAAFVVTCMGLGLAIAAISWGLAGATLDLLCVAGITILRGVSTRLSRARREEG